MKWKCVACSAAFEGPTDHAPESGCPKCGSKHIFDCNVTPVAMPVFLKKQPPYELFVPISWNLKMEIGTTLVLAAMPAIPLRACPQGAHELAGLN